MPARRHALRLDSGHGRDHLPNWFLIMVVCVSLSVVDVLRVKSDAVDAAGSSMWR